jgi:hypothetical protein
MTWEPRAESEDFPFKKKGGAQICQISKEKILAIVRFLLLVPVVGSQKYRKDLISSYLHVSTCGQIWLNHFPDDSPPWATSQKLAKETFLN